MFIFLFTPLPKTQNQKHALKKNKKPSFEMSKKRQDARDVAEGNVSKRDTDGGQALAL